MTGFFRKLDDGLAKADMAYDRMRMLAATKEAKRQSKEAQRWAGWEQRQTSEFPRILARVVADRGTVSSKSLLNDLRVAQLLKQAAGKGEEGGDKTPRPAAPETVRRVEAPCIS